MKRTLLLALAVVTVAAGAAGSWALWATRDPGAGPRVRTNPALPGEGPPRPTTTARSGGDAGAAVVVSGDTWVLVKGVRRGDGACLQVRPVGEVDLDPGVCGASQLEFDGRGSSIGAAPRPTEVGRPPTSATPSIVFGLVPAEAVEVRVFVAAGGDRNVLVATPTRLDASPSAFAVEIPVGGRVERIVVVDAGGRTLVDEPVGD